MLVYGLTIDDNIYTPEIEGKCTPYIYLHGKVEDMNVGKFDLVYVPNMPEEDGIYDCEVRLCDHEELIPCKFFFWWAPWCKASDVIMVDDSLDESIKIDPNDSTMVLKTRGLIVMVGDNKHMEDARQKFNERVSNL